MTCSNCGEATLIQGGSGITVSGSGTPSNPYVVASSALASGNTFRVRDTSSLNLTLTGAGTTADPWDLRGDLVAKVSDLEDVNDPSGPVAGDTMVWVGSGASAHWEFQPPPSNPVSSVNATDGITGTGALSTPLKLSVSGTWGVGPLSGLGSDTTIGLETYIDSAGKVRVRPPNLNVAWTQITGKPTSFPPSPHSHVATDIALAEQRKLDAGKLLGRTITVTANSSTPPSAPAALDLWFFPKGT